MRATKFLIAAAGFALAAASPAAATTCPSGQILRVSKGVCVSKDDAAKAGIVGRHAVKHASVKPDAGKQAKRAPVDAKEENVTTQAKSEPDAAASETTVASAGYSQSNPAALGFAGSPTSQSDVRRNISPFGALQFNGLRRN